ncbi:hypothetical protein D3C79_896060 [compost metagenome]
MGEVKVSSGAFASHLNSTYGEANICNVAHPPGDALKVVNPLLFKRMLADHQEELQTELFNQLKQGNDVDIDFM